MKNFRVEMPNLSRAGGGADLRIIDVKRKDDASEEDFLLFRWKAVVWAQNVDPGERIFLESARE